MALTLQAASQKLSTPSAKLRIAIFRASITSLLNNPDENLTEHATSLADLIFETLYLYDDRASQAAVEVVLAKALKHPQFVKVFVGMLVQNADRSTKAGAFSVYYKLFRWSCLLLRWNPGISTAKVAFSKLAAVQGVLLSSLLHAAFRVKRATRSVFFRTLIEVQGLFELYTNELNGTHLSAYALCGLTEILLDYCSMRSTELLDSHKELFLDLYIKAVLSSKEKPSNALSHAFTPLFKKLTHEDFGKVLVPTAVKMLKRNPELVLEAVGILLKSTVLDLSKYAGDILPVLLVQARHSDESRRRQSVEEIAILASQSSDPDAISSMVQLIKSVIGGSEGKLSFPYQRDGMINSLRALSSAPGGKTLTQLAANVCLFLMSHYKEDGNEEVRCSTLMALGQWISRAGDLAPDGAAAFFLAGLKEKENLRRSHLRSLRLGFQNSQFCMKMHPLCETLLTVSKNWATKPSQRVDCSYALLILFQIASVDVKTDDRIAKEKLWALVLQKDSSIFSLTAVGKMQGEDCIALIELIEVVIVKHYSRLLEYEVGSQQLFQLVVHFLWHSSKDIRKRAFDSVRRIQATSEKFAENLFDGFLSWLMLFEDQIGAHKVSETENVADGAATNLPHTEAIAKALIALAVPALFKDCRISAKVLLACHHPCAVTGRQADMVWKAILRRFKGQCFNAVAALVDDTSSLCEVLLGHHGLHSGKKLELEASLRALHTIMRTIPMEFFPKFLNAFEGLIDTSAHDGLTEADIKIFKTEPGTLSTEQGVYIAEVVTDKNVKQARGRFRMYEDDDQEAVKGVLQPRQPSLKKEAPPAGKKDASKASKKPGEGDKAKSAKEEARELQLKEEAVIRDRVAAIKESLSLGLKALGEVVSGNPVIAHEELPCLAEKVAALLKSPIVSIEAYEALVKLAGCVAPSLRHLAADLAASLTIISTSQFSLLQELVNVPKGPDAQKRKLTVVERVVGGLVLACKEGPLPAPTFAFVFPIMEQVLRLPKKTNLHDDLLEVLSLHTSPVMTLPRIKMLEALYHVLGCIPVYQADLQPVLCELCAGLKPDQLVQALVGVYSQHSHVRVACLHAIKFVPALKKRAVLHDSALANTLWMALHDPEQSNAEVAEEVWDLYSHDLGQEFTGLFTALSHVNYNVRLAASQGLASAMDDYPSSVQETLSTLFTHYVEYLPSVYGELDPNWPVRQGVALALYAAADVLAMKDLPVVSTFLISRALGDPNMEVRARMVDAGIAIIDKHGKDNVGLLFPIFENYLDKKATDEEQYDLVREGVVVFMGALAKHLLMDDPKVSVIIEKLLEVLKTPSESVQRAVSDCLPPLMQSQQENAQALLLRLLKQMMQSEKYGERRGAAFGLAGVVKGLGLPSLKKYGVMDALKAGVEDRNSAKSREGGLFGFECLCEKLGRLFEPYVIHILPLLLVCFSDQVVAVREAADSAARVIMAKLSGQGVKLVLPALLKGLEDKAWRTKQGSVQLLGAMAFCAPRQLSQCLPKIVPKLTEVLTDTHPKVQAAAQTALQQIGSVIRNPEISALVATLLLGISDPNENTKHSLDVLLQTTFVNTVDAPSLALIVPIVHRGLRERSSETKKKGAQIVGNMCSLVTEPKDMLPYLLLLLPEVKKVLVDPIPEVRTVAARALGSLIKGMGEENFKDLVPWLLDTLKSEASGVERSGAAQGLSEVVAALGTAYFESLLPEIIQNCSHQRAAVRDGYLTLFKYLPIALGPMFQNYLPRVLPAILDGLADENESVRDAALGAGHVFVEHYAATSLPLLLPAVEEGIFNDNWRIRQSSVELLGDLLFKVAGTSGKVVLEGGSDDEGASTEAQGRAIVDVLGKDRRNEVLAAVYMVRSDVSLTVRQAALHVWKTVVANTPKTLKEIMPVLMNTLIASLASSSSERRQVAGRSLGELVRKLGGRVLPSIIPILAERLQKGDESTRQGVCIGLSEVLSSAGKDQLFAYMSSLIPTIRDALCDSVSEVREAAGLAFSTLFKSAGMQAVDEIVPNLLNALETEETSETALDGLKQILSVRTAAVLPHILPKLVKPPLTSLNAHALGALAEVAGSGLNSHLATVLPPLIAAMGNKEQSMEPIARKAAETVAMVIDDEGLYLLISELVRGLSDTQVQVRRGSAYLVGFLFKNSKLDLSEEVPNLITILVVMLTDSDSLTVTAAWEALSSVTGSIAKENLPNHVKVLRDAVSTARDKERRKRKGVPITIPGFCLPKALQPVLPIFLQGLMSGSAELREQAAEGLGELIDVTSPDALKPFVVPVTGPLIRIIGDRYPWQVKSAILATLGIIISKGGLALKPFLPQLQTTFIKCLQDNARPVRSRSALALGKLASLSTRVDPLVGDLLNGLQTSDGGVKEAMLIALKGVLKHAGKNLSAPVLTRVLSLQEFLPSDEDEVRGSAARALGMVSQFLKEDELKAWLNGLSTLGQSPGWVARHGAILAIASVLRHAASPIFSSAALLSMVLDIIKARSRDDKVPVRESAAKALGRLMVYQAKTHHAGPSFTELMPLIVAFLKDYSSDVRRRALSSLKSIAKANVDMVSPFINNLGPVLGDLVKDSSTPVRMAAERCVFHVMQLSKGTEAIAASQKFLTGLDARRISKQQEHSDASEDSEEDSPS
ncbi:hypothetical protein GOP47_0021842 [Adiantum capillus-veneris]|uniref:TOG domain-containing protein n=1 Tax=Adiantum capillus-veneris TaxID=13818 RepID=A0A9D4Z6Y1_ADICA|nr:hypothetical protein GOP47_0021842 [Adiantum capillus-veneris]